MKLSTLLELLGVAGLVIAAAAFDWRAGVAVVAVVLLAAGYLVGAMEEQQGGDV